MDVPPAPDERVQVHFVLVDQTPLGEGVRTPGRYVGSEAIEDDGEPFEDKMARLIATLEEQFAESARLEARIKENVERLGL